MGASMNRFYYPPTKIHQDHTHLKGVSTSAAVRDVEVPVCDPRERRITSQGALNPDPESRIWPPHTALSARDAISKPRNVAPFANGDLNLRHG
jgi:hypothetical protein